MKADSGLARAWPLFNWNPAKADEVPIALGGASTSLGYGEGELLRFKFLIRADAKPGSFSALDLSGIKVDENGDIKVTNLPGRITVSNPKILYGDVTGNGEVDLSDAQKILQRVVGTLALPD